MPPIPRSVSVGILLLLPCIMFISRPVCASAGPFKVGAGPTVQNVALDSKVIHRENDLFEENDFAMEISAKVSPVPGNAAIDPAKIRVYYLGGLVMAGSRAYEPKSGRFTLTLTSHETMKVLASTVMANGTKVASRIDHVVRVVAVDERGHEGEGAFDPPKSSVSLESRLMVGYKDRYGRFIEREDESPSPAKRAFGKVLPLVGPALFAASPLELRVASRYAVQPPGELGLDTRAMLTPGTKDTAEFTFNGDRTSYLTTFAANSGKVLGNELLIAAPKGVPRLARRSGPGIYLLSWRSVGRGVVESASTRERLVLPGEPAFEGRAGGALDFLANDRQIVYATAGSIDACDWQGHPLWHTDDTATLPDTDIDDSDSKVTLTPQPDGTVLVFQAATDRAQSDGAQFFSVSRLSGARGTVETSRIVYVPSAAGETRSINAGAAVHLGGHDLAVLNIDHMIGEKFEEETLVLDLERPDWRPVARLTSPGDGRFTVYGAAVVGDRLLVGCGTGGAALLEVSPTPNAP